MTVFEKMQMLYRKVTRKDQDWEADDETALERNLVFLRTNTS